MKRLILTVVAAAGLAAAVSAREYNSSSAPASRRELPRENAAIETADQSPLALETIEKLIPGTDPASPQIAFAVRSNDPLDGSLPEDMATWQIQILDSSDRKVGFIQGRGQPPSSMLAWSGLSGNGEPLPSGFYTARLVWMNKAKKLYTTREVSFNLFAQLKMPKFAELKLGFRFAGGRPVL